MAGRLPVTSCDNFPVHIFVTAQKWFAPVVMPLFKWKLCQGCRGTKLPEAVTVHTSGSWVNSSFTQPANTGTGVRSIPKRKGAF
jgi:hypothetical protein